MTLNEARLLRQKFYLGDTTPTEEEALRAFVCGPSCPADWDDLRAIFEALTALPEVELPDGFEERLAAQLEAAAAPALPAFPQPLAATPEEVPVAPPRPRGLRPAFRLLFRTVAGVAAVATVVWAGVSRLTPQQPTVYVDTYATPQEAALAMEQDLCFIGNELSNATTVDRPLGGPEP